MRIMLVAMAARFLFLLQVVLSVVGLGISSATSQQPPLVKKLIGLRSPPVPEGSQLATPQWFQQKLDHFSDSDTRTWLQRYFYNSSYWQDKKGPVFLMLGGEGPANPAWLATNTDMMRNAEKYGALVFLLEHRYYGESHPTPDVSLSNLVYLSSRQALRDAASFKKFITSNFSLPEDTLWISFGGSYSGALSGWLRMYYPETVTGAVATSGPVQAIVNFYQYLEVVTRSLATPPNGVECMEAISDATYLLDTMLSDEAQWEAVETLFSVSPPLQTEDDVSLLADELAGNFMGVVQYNGDNTAFEGRPNNITITDLCTIMTNANLGHPLQRYAAVNRLLMASTGQKYIDSNFSAQVEFMSNSSWNAESVMGGARQWVYQTCTEFGYYQSSDSAQQVFGDLISLSSQLKTCSAVYQIQPEEVATAVAATNKLYGGTDDIPSNATNIVFPNGSIDPWHALGVLQSPHKSLETIFINGTAHCANMYPPSPHDLPGLVKARDTISSLIQDWLQ